MLPEIEETHRVLKVVVDNASPTKTYSANAELEADYEKLKGLYLIKPTVSFAKFPVLKSFEHNNNTSTFGTDFPLEHLTSSDDVSPDARFKELNLEANKKKISINVFDDGSNPTYPYTLVFVYKLDRKRK